MCVAGLGDFRFAHVEGRYDAIDDTRECWVFGSQREFIFQVESKILQRLRWKEEEKNVWASGYLSMYIMNAEEMKGFSWNLTLRRFIYCLLSTSFKHILYYCDYSHPRTPTNAHIYMKSQITHAHEHPYLFQR